jgi:DNA modification methylase
MSTDVEVIHGDCLEVMRCMADASVDAVVTDPPYDLTSGNGRGFMDKAWDGTGIAFRVELWAEVIRALKPGGHLLAFGGTRTYHRMTCAIEDAGFEIRDSIHWIYGQGFPKSRNLKGEFKGLGTALKPSHEPIVLARKPLDGTVARNVAEHGTGALNIDGCRVSTEERLHGVGVHDMRGGAFGAGHRPNPGDLSEYEPNPAGRWPSNTVFLHVSLPVMKLVGNIPPDVANTIGRYFDGYVRLRAMREDRGHRTVPDSVRETLLQLEVQERRNQDTADQDQGRDGLSAMRRDVHGSEGVVEGRASEVLQPDLSESLSPNLDGREGGTLRKTALGRGSGEDVPNEDGSWVGTERRSASRMEGRAMSRQRRLHQSDDRFASAESEGDGSAHASEAGVHRGASSRHGDDVGEAVGAEGGRPSQERHQGRQPAGQSDADGLGEALSEASAYRAGNGLVDGRERGIANGECTFEVLACDVPAQWLGYFELTGEDLGCRPCGTKRVKSGTAYESDPKPMSRSIYGATETLGRECGYAAADGLETVEAWECVEGCPVAEMDRQSGELRARGNVTPTKRRQSEGTWGRHGSRIGIGPDGPIDPGDSGGASRFFPTFAWEADDFAFTSFRYCAKASREERNAGLDGMPKAYNDFQRESCGLSQGKNPETGERSGNRCQPQENHHPTVKPVALVQWLCRLITPPGGLILDCFLGSGTTGVAAIREGFRLVGIEDEAEYIPIAEARIAEARRRLERPHAPTVKVNGHKRRSKAMPLFDLLDEGTEP